MATNDSTICYSPECVQYELPKVEDHYSPLVSTFYHIPVILVIYFLSVKVYGPRWMKDREPYQLKGAILLYNVLQVIYNAYLVYLPFSEWGFVHMIRSWSNICHPLGATIGFTPLTEQKYLKAIYLYHLNKILDLLDTVFFVLRKKDSQVTFLHLFHHSTMVANSWFTMVPFREQVVSLFGLINSTLHVLMYSYYFLAAFGPKVQKYLWWKKHLTQMQLVQFVGIFILLGKMKVENCKSSPWFWAMWVFNVGVYFALFLQFYISSYKKKKGKHQ